MTRSLTTARWRRALRTAAAAAAALAMALTAAPAFANGGGGGGGGGGGSVSPALKSITFVPATVVGGGGETATVTFATAASEGAVAVLTSSDPAVAGFDPNASGEAVVTPGQSSAAFAIVTTPVASTTTVTITATAFGGATTVSAALTVSPGTPPAADTVRVTEFRWDAGIQTIEATGSNPNAILTVFDADGTFTGITLTNQGGGRYQNQHEEVFRPDQPIIVKSNFGGSGTATVTS